MGCAEVVPGISGGTVALIVGVYDRLLLSIRATFSSAVAAIRLDLRQASSHLREVHWSLVLPLRDRGYLAVFAAGAVVGLGLFARSLVKLLRDHRDITVAALLGLMVGSLRALWPWTAADGALLAPPSGASAVPVALMAVCGVAAVLTLLWAQRHHDAPAHG